MQDRAYSERLKKLVGGLEGEIVEQRREDREEGKSEREETGWKEETWSMVLSGLVLGGVSIDHVRNYSLLRPLLQISLHTLHVLRHFSLGYFQHKIAILAERKEETSEEMRLQARTVVQLSIRAIGGCRMQYTSPRNPSLP